MDHLRKRGVEDLARITLFSDGTTVYECASAEEVVDLLQGGQRVRHRVSGAMRELTGTIADFPGERADGGVSEAAPEDELAAARTAPAAPDSHVRVGPHVILMTLAASPAPSGR